MTLPYEQYIAINNTREFLFSLMDSQKTKVPLAIRKRARELLKHFPMECDANDMVRCHTEWLHEVNRKGDSKRGSGDPIYYSPRHGGWIFWDETEQNPSMAYVSRRNAEEALDLYIKELNDEAKHQTDAVNHEAVGKDHYIEDSNGPTAQ